jgi:hypothetical protein
VYKDSNNAEHGLIASLADIITGNAVLTNISTLIGSSAQSTWDGLTNTNAFATQAGCNSGAALLCYNYSSGGYTDWYLPAIDELSLLYFNRFIINQRLTLDNNPATIPLYVNLFYLNFNFAAYWSSTESTIGDDALYVTVGDYISIGTKNIDGGNVRAIRRF